MSAADRVLVVDLDGTLIKTDMLLENYLSKFKQHPINTFFQSFYVLKGIAALKNKLSSNWDFDPALLPYCEEVLLYVKQAKKDGAKIVLATASDERIANRIANYLGFFDEVISTDLEKNNARSKKLEQLNQRYQPKGYDYLANSRSDLKVWEGAKKALVVGAPKTVHLSLGRTHNDVELLDRQAKFKPQTIFKAIRIHQWVKNLLLFVPILMAHKVFNISVLFNVFLAFISFNFCASAVYVLNDLLDLSSDRQHPKKRFRAFASGELSIQLGLFLFPVLLALGVLITFFLPQEFSFVLGIYLLLTTLYSFWLKQLPLVDILLLAGLFTIRVFAGGVAAHIPVSHWLLLFSMFMFLSLACAKRVSELYVVRKNKQTAAAGRGYKSEDLEQVKTFGVASGYISVLVLALFVTSKEVKHLYGQPEVLWLICPLILYWISRIWLITHRGELHEDPIVFALQDKVSYLIGLLCALLIFWEFRLPMDYQSWGKYPKVVQDVRHLRWLAELPAFNSSKSYLAQGMARSYGDVCLNDENIIISTHTLKRIQNFDSKTGILEAEAGLSLAEILDFAVPKGWFIPVPPGTKFVSLGGAIANDIHGKNHHTQGTFGRSVLSFKLLKSTGEILDCSLEENQDFFSATIAGLGLTGVILTAKIQLKKISSAFIDSETIQYKGLDEFFALSDDSDGKFEYTAAWIDCVSKGSNFARGIFYRGNHSQSNQEDYNNKKIKLSVPFNFPNFALNKLSMLAFNQFWYHKQLSKKVVKKVHYNPFFFPLDGVLNWNRIYGKRGFFQFQCVLPPDGAKDVLEDLILNAADAGKASFLAVIKQFGNLKSPGMMSFPRKGTTLTMDFPNSGDATKKLMQSLYNKVIDAGGSIYPAKDALLTEQMFKRCYPMWNEFSKFIDPNFSSSFWRRVMGVAK